MFKLGSKVIYGGVTGTVTGKHIHFKGDKWEVTFNNENKDQLYFHLDGRFHKFEVKPTLKLLPIWQKFILYCIDYRSKKFYTKQVTQIKKEN